MRMQAKEILARNDQQQRTVRRMLPSSSVAVETAPLCVCARDLSTLSHTTTYASDVRYCALKPFCVFSHCVFCELSLFVFFTPVLKHKNTIMYSCAVPLNDYVHVLSARQEKSRMHFVLSLAHSCRSAHRNGTRVGTLP